MTKRISKTGLTHHPQDSRVAIASDLKSFINFPKNQGKFWAVIFQPYSSCELKLLREHAASVPFTNQNRGVVLATNALAEHDIQFERNLENCAGLEAELRQLAQTYKQMTEKNKFSVLSIFNFVAPDDSDCRHNAPLLITSVLGESIQWRNTKNQVLTLPEAHWMFMDPKMSYRHVPTSAQRLTLAVYSQV